MAADAKKETVEVIDETSSEDTDSKKGKLGSTVTKEATVFAKAASIYFDTYQTLHKESEDKKKNNAMKNLVANTTKAHKAAWKHVLQNSPIHKENERVMRKFVTDSGFDKVYTWLDDKDEDD